MLFFCYYFINIIVFIGVINIIIYRINYFFL